jgi:hypothetical protein
VGRRAVDRQDARQRAGALAVLRDRFQRRAQLRRQPPQDLAQAFGFLGHERLGRRAPLAAAARVFAAVVLQPLFFASGGHRRFDVPLVPRFSLTSTE